jgi:hypothetical protein
MAKGKVKVFLDSSVPLPAAIKLEKYRGVAVDEDLPVLVSAIECGADYLVTGIRELE